MGTVGSGGIEEQQATIAEQEAQVSAIREEEKATSQQEAVRQAMTAAGVWNDRIYTPLVTL